MTPSAPLTPPIPFRLLIDEAVKITRRHFRSIYFAVAIPIALFSVVSLFAQLKWLHDIFQITRTRAGLAEIFSSFLPLAGAAMVHMTLLTIGVGAMLAASMDAVAGRPVDMKRRWLFMLRPKVIGTSLLCGLLVLVGFLFCLFPGIYIGLLLSFVIPVMVEENLFGMGAMRRSAQLVRHNPHRRFVEHPMVKVFALGFLGWLLGYVVGVVVQLPLIVVQQIIIFREVAEQGPNLDPSEVFQRTIWLQIPSNVLGVLAYMAINLYMCMCIVHLFHDVRRRKEGADLEAAIAEITHEPPAATAT